MNSVLEGFKHRRFEVVVGYPGVTDAGNGGPWE